MQNIPENTESPSSSSDFSEFKNLFNCVSALELQCKQTFAKFHEERPSWLKAATTAFTFKTLC